MPDVQVGGIKATLTGRQPCTPGIAIGAIMLPLALWFAADYMHLTPRAAPPKLVATPEAAKRFQATAPPPPPPSPPPPKPLEDWQLVRNGNACCSLTYSPFRSLQRSLLAGSRAQLLAAHARPVAPLGQLGTSF